MVLLLQLPHTESVSKGGVPGAAEIGARRAGAGSRNLCVHSLAGAVGDVCGSQCEDCGRGGGEKGARGERERERERL